MLDLLVKGWRGPPHGAALQSIVPWGGAVGYGPVGLLLVGGGEEFAELVADLAALRLAVFHWWA